jgi:Protein of unknown function (DUF2587)
MSANDRVQPDLVLSGDRTAGGGGDHGESVAQPAKVMRIGSMIKQLLEEVRQAPLDDASRGRLREIYDQSIRELASGLSADLQEELGRMALPFGQDATPSDAELRIAQAQLVGWLEGLFHGIQATLFRPADDGPQPAGGDAPARVAVGRGRPPGADRHVSLRTEGRTPRLE